MIQIWVNLLWAFGYFATQQWFFVPRINTILVRFCFLIGAQKGGLPTNALKQCLSKRAFWRWLAVFSSMFHQKSQTWSIDIGYLNWSPLVAPLHLSLVMSPSCTCCFACLSVFLHRSLSSCELVCRRLRLAKTHHQKGIPSHHLSGLSLEDTRLCGALPNLVGGHHYTGLRSLVVQSSRDTWLLGLVQRLWVLVF